MNGWPPKPFLVGEYGKVLLRQGKRRRRFLMRMSFQQKRITLFKTPVFVAGVVISLLIGCSHTSENNHSEAMVFQGEGEKWEVSIPDEVILKNGKNIFRRLFALKGIRKS
jgi:hypothetical protein